MSEIKIEEKITNNLLDFINPIKIGNRNYFDRNELEEWIESKKVVL